VKKNHSNPVVPTFFATHVDNHVGMLDINH